MGGWERIPATEQFCKAGVLESFPLIEGDMFFIGQKEGDIDPLVNLCSMRCHSTVTVGWRDTTSTLS